MIVFSSFRFLKSENEKYWSFYGLFIVKQNYNFCLYLFSFRMFFALSALILSA